MRYNISTFNRFHRRYYYYYLFVLSHSWKKNAKSETKVTRIQRKCKKNRSGRVRPRSHSQFKRKQERSQCATAAATANVVFANARQKKKQNRSNSNGMGFKNWLFLWIVKCFQQKKKQQREKRGIKTVQNEWSRNKKNSSSASASTYSVIRESVREYIFGLYCNICIQTDTYNRRNKHFLCIFV